MSTAATVLHIDGDALVGLGARRSDPWSTAERRLVEASPLRTRVLVIGCGTGAFARELATRRGARVAAIDASAAAIDLARRRTPTTLGIEYRVADLLELSPRGFDAVVAVHWLGAASSAGLHRVVEALRPGGTVVLLEHAGTGGMRGWLRARRALAEVRPLLQAVIPAATVRHHLDGSYAVHWRKPAAHPAGEGRADIG